jgi:hypothetical protein
MPATKKTDNHFVADKVALRAKYSPWAADGSPLRVLDAFGGFGVCWAAVRRLTGRPVMRIAIDQRHDLMEFHNHGENIKVMSGMDLSAFDAIDLDAYGIPAAQLDIVFGSPFRGVVFVTAIQSMQGGLPNLICEQLGFPKAIQQKAPSLVARRGWEYFREWLAVRGVSRIVHRSWNRKHYLAFAVNGAELREADWDSPAAGRAASLS